MNCNKVEIGLRVKITKLGKTTGMMIASKHLTIRKEGVTGIVKNWVPGHDRDVWFVKHEDTNEIGAYAFNEFEPA
jgi:hypothetical protein